jgi:hypothetical protein
MYILERGGKGSDEFRRGFRRIHKDEKRKMNKVYGFNTSISTVTTI